MRKAITENLMKSSVPAKPSDGSRARNVDGQTSEDCRAQRTRQLVTTVVAAELLGLTVRGRRNEDETYRTAFHPHFGAMHSVQSRRPGAIRHNEIGPNGGICGCRNLLKRRVQRMILTERTHRPGRSLSSKSATMLSTLRLHRQG
jgi:hypothetical protein